MDRGVRMEGDRPIAHIAGDLGIDPEALRKRARRAEVDAGKRAGLRGDEREELVRLRRENLGLRRANSIDQDLIRKRPLDSYIHQSRWRWQH